MTTCPTHGFYQNVNGCPDCNAILHERKPKKVEIDQESLRLLLFTAVAQGPRPAFYPVRKAMTDAQEALGVTDAQIDAWYATLSAR